MGAKPDELRENIANRLREAREAAGLSQGQVAKRLDMHRPTISEIEAGRRRVTGEDIARLSDLYGVDANWITEGQSGASAGTDKIMLAARQLSKLKDKDLDRLLKLLQMLRGAEGSDESK
jgi:transcriptional regulator with XRE-family HTH domain